MRLGVSEGSRAVHMRFEWLGAVGPPPPPRYARSLPRCAREDIANPG
jgi:hypothetical protein